MSGKEARWAIKLLCKSRCWPGGNGRSSFPYLCIAPAILLFAVFTIYPFIRTIVLSFALTDKTGNFSQWVGLANWKRVLS